MGIKGVLVSMAVAVGLGVALVTVAAASRKIAFNFILR